MKIQVRSAIALVYVAGIVLATAAAVAEHKADLKTPRKSWRAMGKTDYR